MSGQPAPGLTLAVAGWMAHMRHIASLPEPRAVTDPILPAIIRANQTSGTDSTAFVAHLLALDQVFPPRITALARALRAPCGPGRGDPPRRRARHACPPSSRNDR